MKRAYEVRLTVTVSAFNAQDARETVCRMAQGLRQMNEGRVLHSHVGERREGVLAWLRRRFAKDKFRGRSLMMVTLLLAVIKLQAPII